MILSAPTCSGFQRSEVPKVSKLVQNQRMPSANPTNWLQNYLMSTFLRYRTFVQEGHLEILNDQSMSVFYISDHSDKIPTTSPGYHRVLFHKNLLLLKPIFLCEALVPVFLQHLKSKCLYSCILSLRYLFFYHPTKPTRLPCPPSQLAARSRPLYYALNGFHTSPSEPN